MKRSLFASLLLACASAPPAPASVAAPTEPPPDVAYSLDLRAPDSIAVVAHATAAAAARGLRLPVDWEGRAGLDDNVVVEEVKVGGRTATHRIERWTLHADGAGDWEVRYRVGARARLDEESEGFPIRAESYAYATGHPIFLFPDVHAESGEGRYRVVIAAPDGWAVTTTWEGAAVQGLDALRGGVILAGDWRVTRHDVGGPLTVALRGAFGWPDEDLAAPLAAIVRATRRFFGGDARPLTFVLAPWRAERTQIAHTVPGGVLLVAGHDFDPGEPDSASLLAREIWKIWVGGVLRHAPDAEYAGLWFREGLAAYYGVVLPLRAGLLPASLARERLQEALVNAYLRLPVRDAKLYDVQRWYWWDKRVHDTVAGKGALAALLLDLELRAGCLTPSDGTCRGTSLDGFVARMWERFGLTGRRTSARDLTRELSSYAGRDLAPFVERHLLGIEPMPIAERLRAAGFRVDAAREEFPDFGLGWRAQDGSPVLEGVRASGPAHRKGCREGAVVLEYSVPAGRFDVEAAVT
ncbi:MAG: hypothetical protein AABZ30_07940, partial [Myxococcota bacterium]